MFEAFQQHFTPDINAAPDAAGAPPDLAIPGLGELIARFGGGSFNGGLYRIVRASDIGAWNERVSLGDELNERVRGFSAGMRRRLALARLILRPPRLLLLDEPYAAFDQHGIDFVNEFVRDTAARGGACIIVTHDPARVAEVSHRMVRIVDGRIEDA